MLEPYTSKAQFIWQAGSRWISRQASRQRLAVTTGSLLLSCLFFLNFIIMNSVALCSSGSNNSDGNSSSNSCSCSCSFNCRFAKSPAPASLAIMSEERERVCVRETERDRDTHRGERGRPSNHALKFFAPSDKGVCLAIPVRNGGYL